MPDVEYMKRLAEKLERGEVPFLGANDTFEFACDQCGKCCRDREDILLSPLDIFHLSKATGKTGKEILEKYGEMPVLYAGGVMSNKLMRSALAKDRDAHFAEAEFSADNAAGVALLARLRALAEVDG